MLIITFFIDYDHMIIVDNILYFFVAIGVFCCFFIDVKILNNFLGAVIGYFCYFLIYWVSKFYYKKEAFGFGDVMLMGAIGFFLSYENFNTTFYMLFSPFYIGFILVVFQMIKEKNIKLKAEIPFAPAMCTSAFVLSILKYVM